MNLNPAAYTIYLAVTVYITVYVGRVLYKSGQPFLEDSFHGQKEMATAYNNFLLTGYYLVNLGYASLSISGWGGITNWVQLTEEVSSRLGILILLLGIMHYVNMYSFSHFSKQLKGLYDNLK